MKLSINLFPGTNFRSLEKSCSYSYVKTQKYSFDNTVINSSVKWSVFFKLLTYMGLHKLNIYILVTEVCYLTLKFPRFCGLSAQLLVFQ